MAYVWFSTVSGHQAFVFLRDFVLGSNETGLVTNSSGSVSVVGGENVTLAAPVLPGQLGIYKGSGTTQSTYTFPSATIAAWNSFFANVTAISALPGASNISTQSGHAMAIFAKPRSVVAMAVGVAAVLLC